jgi:hypothetical protein
MNLNKKEMILYLIPGQVKFIGVENNLPKGYEPKINIKIVKHPKKELHTDGVKEDINIPVKVGDTVLMGKFKNKKVKIKSIGKDEHGMPTINGKKATTFRIHNIVNIFDESQALTKEWWKNILEGTTGALDAGEPDTGYIKPGKSRMLHPFDMPDGMVQVAFPIADDPYGAEDEQQSRSP